MQCCQESSGALSESANYFKAELISMKRRTDVRKGSLVARVLTGSWRSAEVSPLELSEPELDEITPLLCISGVAALAWERVTQTPLRESASGEVLHQAARLQSLQAAIQEEKIEKLFRLLREASVEAVLVKGWSAASLYSNRDLRPLGDIDICVRPADLSRIEEILRLPEASDCWVDLHHRFSELSDRSLDQMFARTQLVPLGNEQIRVLAQEDQLALLCVHLLKHGAWRPLWLCDIAVAIESLPESFDWDMFLGNQRRTKAWIAASIGLAQNLLGTRTAHLPLDPTLMAVPAWLVRSVLEHWSDLVPGDRLPMRPAPLMAGNMSSLKSIVTGAIARWPDPITATFNLDGEFNRFPRLPYQFADFILLSTRYLFRLPGKLQSGRE